MTSRATQGLTASQANGRSRRAPRILTAVPICDGHDSAIMTVNLELVRHGVEVVYLGYHRSVRDIVRAAIQEDVQGVGISSYNGGHVEFFSKVLSELRREGARGVGVFGGGGGTITTADARVLERRGVERIFFPGASLTTMAEWVRDRYGRRQTVLGRLPTPPTERPDLRLAKLLSAVEAGVAAPAIKAPGATPVVGVTGPGGAGKTTLIDELVRRILKRRPGARLAILSHDPGAIGGGAMLGDRATLVYSQDDRVFMRSLQVRGRSAGLARTTRSCLEILRRSGFDFVLVETAGIGQETLPFGRGLVDRQLLVMSPEYGGRLQLQKIAMLERADIVVVNKADLPGARTAVAELGERLDQNGRGQILVSTVARRHGDAGVDQLCREVWP